MPSGYLMIDPIFWGAIATSGSFGGSGCFGYISGCSPAVQGHRQESHDVYQTAKCFACGKFFKLSGRFVFTAKCPHCNSEASC
jgi:hypothetical protein